MENGVGDQLTCGQCQQRVDSLTAFLLHKVQHVDTGQPGGCPLCGMAFSRQVSLREHLHRKHSIPDLKCSNTGKRRGRPRSKKLGDSPDTTSPGRMPSEEQGGSASGLSNIPPSFVGQETMHVVVDKISEGDLRPLSASHLSSAVLHTDCSALCPSSSATVIVETCRDSEFGHLVPEQVNHVSTPSHPFQPAHTLQDHGDSSQDQSSHCVAAQPPQPGACNVQQNSSQDLGNQLHLLQSHHPDSLHTETTVMEQKGYVSEAAVTVSESVVAPEESTAESASCLSLQQQQQPTQPLAPSTVVSESVPASEKEGELDFVFILLMSHVKRKSMNYSKQSFKCFHCQYKTFWRRALVKHMRDTHSDNLAIHQCIAVSSSEKLQGQQVMRMSDYLAALARQRKQVNGNRIRGVERQDLPGYHPCHSCDKVFGRLRYLRKHQVIHRQEKKHLCDDCGKAFKTKAYLAAHRQTHQAKVYRCGQCDFTSSINALIHTHRQLHNDNSVICEVCGSAYNDRATLKKHKQVHDKSRPFPCDYPGCTWRFKTQVMCRAHYRAHTTCGRFVCTLCSYVFRHKHHLQRHLGKIHGLDEATVYRTTCGTKSVAAAHPVKSVVCENKEYVGVLKGDGHHPGMSDTVSLIVDAGLSSEQLQSVLESGQFVIASNSPVNYEIANIAMNVGYDALTDHASGAVSAEGQAVFIPGNAECSQIIFQQDVDTGPSNVEM